MAYAVARRSRTLPLTIRIRSLSGLRGLGAQAFCPGGTSSADGHSCITADGRVYPYYQPGDPLPPGCDAAHANDLLSRECHPEWHSEFQLPGGSTGNQNIWVEQPDGSFVWSGPGPEPATKPLPQTAQTPQQTAAAVAAIANQFANNTTASNPPPSNTTSTDRSQSDPTAQSIADALAAAAANQKSNQTAASAPPTPITVSLVNTSRAGNSSFLVGDSWTLTVTGAPNQPVSVSATQNGKALGTTPMGNTDSNGRFTITGAMDASTVGAWVETWIVGSTSSAPVPFQVYAVTADNTGTNTGPTDTTLPAPAPASSTFSDIATWLSQSTLWSAVPNWLLVTGVGLGGIVAYSALGGKHK